MTEALETTDPLVELGFTQLEAQIYGLLLEQSAITGYRVAQQLGKPAPNVYKALESLAAKGAVMIDDGRRRLCRALPPEELLRHLDRRFQSARERAARELAERARPSGDQRVYQLQSFEAVFERARTMLEDAAEVVLVDAFPRCLDLVADELAAHAARGVLVAVKAYEPKEIHGVEVMLGASPTQVLERWPGEWLNVVVDSRQSLIAFLDLQGSRVHQALWSGSVFLSWVYHSALVCELVLDRVEQRLESGADAAQLHRELERLEPLKTLRSSGYRELIERLEISTPQHGG